MTSRSALSVLRRTSDRAVISWRVRTNGLRVLPDVLIIGAQKAGTSSLLHDLVHHPDVLRAPGVPDELHFFDYRWHRGPDHYRSYFPTRLSMAAHQRRTGRRALCLDKSPTYLLHPMAARRAQSVVPDARILVLLREPVARLVSQYQMTTRLGVEDLPLEEALDAEVDRLSRQLARWSRDERAGRADHLTWHSYLARSRYAEQLDRWVEAFGRDALLILRSEDVWSDPVGRYRAVLDFVGLAECPPTLAAMNQSPTRLDLDPGLRARIQRELADDTTLLAQRYGISWSDSGPAEVPSS